MREVIPLFHLKGVAILARENIMLRTMAATTLVVGFLVALSANAAMAAGKSPDGISRDGRPYWNCGPRLCNNKGGKTAWDPKSCKPHNYCPDAALDRRLELTCGPAVDRDPSPAYGEGSVFYIQRCDV